MPDQCICVDIDNTLLVSYAAVSGDDCNLRHLEFVTLKTTTAKYDFYAINLKAMKLIFKALLDKKVQIIFVTAAKYDASILYAFESLYDLDKGSLINAIYINRHSKYYSSKHKKGAIIKAAQVDGLLADDLDILLLDDNDQHLADALANEYKVIKALGYPSDESEICNDYLHEIIAAFKLPIILSHVDPAQRMMKKFKMSFG